MVALAVQAVGARMVRRGPTPHGTYNGYTNYRCRCAACRDANNAFERERKRRNKLPVNLETARQNAERRQDRVAIWTAVRELGRAGAVCDSIVRSRPVPDRLLVALFASADEEAA